MIPSEPLSFFRFFDLTALAIFLPAMGWLMWREYRRTLAPFATISHMVPLHRSRRFYTVP